ncbi:MAG: hypothetical protein ACTHU0_22350 [Kofleriaceae bacterium]
MDLRAVVRHYKQNFRARARAELESFRGLPSLEIAVRRAAIAITLDEKRFAHQRRLKEAHLARAEAKLMGCIEKIRATEDFAALFALVKRTVGHLGGLGELYVYDTALRISAKKGTLPRRVYLHAGARMGAKALNIEVQGVVGLFRSELPGELRELEPHEIEDVLCIYKQHFTGERPDLEDQIACWSDDDVDEDDGLLLVRPVC